MSVRSLLHQRSDDEKPNLQIHWPVAPPRSSNKYYGLRISLLGSYHLSPMNSIGVILQITCVGLFCVSIAFGSCGLQNCYSSIVRDFRFPMTPPRQLPIHC